MLCYFFIMMESFPESKANRGDLGIARQKLFRDWAVSFMVSAMLEMPHMPSQVTT
jgi:hypothetical protein